MVLIADALEAPQEGVPRAKESDAGKDVEKAKTFETVAEIEKAGSIDGTPVEIKPPEQGLQTVDTFMTSFEAEALTDDRLYRDGKLVLQPAPTRDPKDPLNLPLRRKMAAVLCLCFFGALAAAAELILGAMLPVFALQYAGVNPKELLPLSQNFAFLPKGSDPLKILDHLTAKSPPIWKVYLLASLPILTVGVTNLALVPLAISIGRRFIMLSCGSLALVGAIWAGFSQSLDSHLAARCLQALGVGTVESLIPFIIQDMVHVHQRNTWISCVFACQGIIIISLGFASPYMIIYLSWRWVYLITASTGALFLVGVILLLPETRWERTRAEMNGIPRDDGGVIYTPRTWTYDWALFHGKISWRKGWNAFVNTLRTFFYPQIFFITMLNSAMIATALAAGYTVAPALLTKPWGVDWSFLHLGYLLVSVLIAAIFVGLVTGGLADWVANTVAKKRGKRLPENQLINLILPTICGLVGSVLFGVTAENPEKYSWVLFLFGLLLMAFGFLGTNTIGAVYVLECYPHLAGPALVNIASFRCLIAFVFSFKVSEWIAHDGYLKSMMIYTGIMAFFSLLIPLVWFFGPAWRKRWPADTFGDHM